MIGNFSKDSLRKRWVLKDDGKPESFAMAKTISEKLGVSQTMAQLLFNRGYKDADSAYKFIHMESELLCDPFDLKDVREAIARIARAVESGERIVVYGDYDVDGVTAVCTLYLYLSSKGANVGYYIPNRAGEGYGVSRPAIDRLAEEGCSLIITVDTGITAADEVEYAKSLGIDTVVTDHHECHAELPRAVAVVNPHRPDCPYPFKELAGVGVVFKLICAYEEETTGDSKRECIARLCHEYADLVAIGTIADVMPIKDENKLIVGYGLRRMEKQRRPGLAALMEAASPQAEQTSRRRNEQKITSGYIGFTIAPRLNAAGRMRSATIAVELFLSKDSAEASRIAAELCDINKERQAEENRIITEAYAKIEAEHNFDSHPVIVLDADSWHHGVIGIVSSRITERYGLPSILVSFEGCDSENHQPSDVGKGSGRSIKGMNLVEALTYCAEHLVKHGGHELAAGLSVTRAELPAFREKINEYAREHLSEEDTVPTIEADCVLSLADIHMELASELRMLEPYGVSNPLPVFAMYSVVAEEIIPVSGGKHTRLIISDGINHVTAMYFSKETASLDLYQGERVDILFCIDINEWYGRRTVQLILKDLRPAEREAAERVSDKKRFEELFAGAPLCLGEDVVPGRDDFAAVYTVIRRYVRGGGDTISMRRMASLLHAEGRDVGYVKLKFIFRILEELDLLGVEETEEDVFRFRLRFAASRVDLEKSNVLRRLRTRAKLHG